MKKNRLTAIVLTFVLLFGCLSVLPVFAEETDSAQVDVVAQNIVYSDTIRIAYALDCSVEDAKAGNVKLSYTVDGVTKLATLWKNGEELYEGKPIFVTRGFHANEFTDVVTAVAYTGATAPEGAIAKTYSVAEYLFAQLYKYDFINKTEQDGGEDGLDFERRELYLALMSYGTQAQKILDKADESALLDNYCYLWTTEQAVTINGAKSALVAPGATVALAGADAFVLDSGNEPIEVGASYVSAKGMVAKVSAVAVDPTKPVVSTFEDGNVSNNYVSHSAAGSYIQFSVAEDPTNAANKVLQVERTGGTATHEWTTIKASNNVHDGNCITFETDVYVGRRSGYLSYLRVYGKNSSGEDTSLLSFTFQITANSNSATDENGASDPYIVIKQEGSGTYNAGTLTTTAFKPNKWVNIRLEFYRGGADTSTYTKLFIDGECVLDGNYHGGNVSTENFTFDSVRIWQRATAGTSGTSPNQSYFDNIYVTKTDKAYSPESAE